MFTFFVAIPYDIIVLCNQPCAHKYSDMNKTEILNKHLKIFYSIFSSCSCYGVQKLRATVFTQKGFKRYICDIVVMSGSFASITCSVFHVSCKCTYYHYAKYNCTCQNVKLNRSINYDHLRKKPMWVKHIFCDKMHQRINDLKFY